MSGMTNPEAIALLQGGRTSLPRRARLDRQCVHLVAQQIGERAVDRALPGDPVLAGKGGTFDLDGEMALARTIMTRMAAMIRAVVDDGKPDRG